MPYEIRNKVRGASTLRVTGIGATPALALSAFSANVGTENVSSVTLTSVQWSVLPATGILTITRDALVVATLYETGKWERDEVVIANTNTGTVTVTIAGGGTALLTFSKAAVYNISTLDIGSL